jgi:hypothetical protein
MFPPLATFLAGIIILEWLTDLKNKVLKIDVIELQASLLLLFANYCDPLFVSKPALKEIHAST